MRGLSRSTDRPLRKVTAAGWVIVALAFAAPTSDAQAQKGDARPLPPFPATVPSAQPATPTAAATPGLPQLQVDPFWPKPLPKNWIIGQVSGVAVDKRDHVWIVHRPASLSDREVGAQQNPPWSKCC